MPLTDPLGDMLTRIRNGQQARKDSVMSPASKLRARVLDVLQREGYIRGYVEEALGPAKGLRIELKYFEGRPAIQHVSRVSKPGRRVYSGSQDLPRARNGLGYRAAAQGKNLRLQLGYSHDVNIAVPDDLTVATPDQTTVVISGNDRQRVGQLAAEVRQWRKPEPYKGKGIKYRGEFIFRKE